MSQIEAKERSERERRDNAGPLLLAAAKRLFAEKGYEEVSTRELADAAGVNLAAIQYHFGSKAKLFSDAVRSLMEESGCIQKAALIGSNPTTPADSAATLFDFIHGYLSELLRPRGPQACRIMFREMLCGSMENVELRQTLVATVVEHVTRPVDETLGGLLAMIVPDTQKRDLERAVQSIVGQCSFYVSHRPFIEHLRGVSCAESPYFDETVVHVFRFSLRALGCPPALIEETIQIKTACGGNEASIGRSANRPKNEKQEHREVL